MTVAREMARQRQSCDCGGGNHDFTGDSRAAGEGRTCPWVTASLPLLPASLWSRHSHPADPRGAPGSAMTPTRPSGVLTLPAPPLCSAVFLGLRVMSGNRENSRLPRGVLGWGGRRTGFQRASDPCPCAPSPSHVCAAWVPVSAGPQLTTHPRTLPAASTTRPQWLHGSTCSGSSAGFPGAGLRLACLRLSERCRPLPSPLPSPLPAAALQGPAKGRCVPPARNVRTSAESLAPRGPQGGLVRLLQPFPAPGQASDCRSLRCSPCALGCPARPGRRALPSTCLKLQAPGALASELMLSEPLVQGAEPASPQRALADMWPDPGRPPLLQDPGCPPLLQDSGPSPFTAGTAGPPRPSHAAAPCHTSTPPRQASRGLPSYPASGSRSQRDRPRPGPSPECSEPQASWEGRGGAGPGETYSAQPFIAQPQWLGPGWGAGLGAKALGPPRRGQ